MGISGFRDTHETLEQVSAAKADLDDMKGKTLEEMSAINKEIQRNIQARQNELKPLVARLQEQRKEKAQIESKYLQAKQRYQNAVSEYDTACFDLEEESKRIRTDLFVHQSKFHTVSSKLGELNRALKRAREESNAQETGNPISRDIKSYTDFFQKAARTLKKSTRDLKEQKKQLGTETDVSQKQLELFQSLRRLLQVKLQCLRVLQKDRADAAKADEMEVMGGKQVLIIEN
jgi:intraflagellar transport protein 81